MALVEHEFGAAQPPRRVVVRARDLHGWDSSLLILVAGIDELSKERGIPAEYSGLPGGITRLIELAETVPENTDAREPPVPSTWLERLGTATINLNHAAGESLDFLGAVTLSFANLVRHKARYRYSDLLEVVQQCGADALVIVTLISDLVGMILAFMGAVQLQRVGAPLYVADLVADRNGARDGRDDDRDHHVRPHRRGLRGAAGHDEGEPGDRRADHDGHLADGISRPSARDGADPDDAAAVRLLRLSRNHGWRDNRRRDAASFAAHLPDETIHALSFDDLAGGLFKATAYGVLIAYAGCLRGLQCGASSSAVGDAATAAVVTGIVMIVTACGLFAWLFHVLGI